MFLSAILLTALQALFPRCRFLLFQARRNERVPKVFKGYHIVEQFSPRAFERPALGVQYRNSIRDDCRCKDIPASYEGNGTPHEKAQGHRDDGADFIGSTGKHIHAQ